MFGQMQPVFCIPKGPSCNSIWLIILCEIRPNTQGGNKSGGYRGTKDDISGDCLPHLGWAGSN